MNNPSIDYNDIIGLLKEKIRNARLNAVLTANAFLLEIYWEIGKVISENEGATGWGSKTIPRLSVDLKTEFEDMRGFSERNLRYMRDFYKAYPYSEIWQQAIAKLEIVKNQSNIIWQQAVAKLPWGHHTLIITRTRTLEERVFYTQKSIENNWNRATLSLNIDSDLFKRSKTTLTNFDTTLPSIQADLAEATFKNAYLFDFLAMGEKMKERELEKGLVRHLKKFMQELGRGFAYVGNQYNLNVEGDDFFLDLLFYSIPMKCYVIFELKIGDFKPEYAGKLNFYINTVDEQIKTASENRTIGVLLCKTPNETVVKFALQGITSPINVSEFQLADSLPSQIKSEMPTIEELENEMEIGYEELKSPSQRKLDALKERLHQLKGPEARLTATKEILHEITDKSLLPLFHELLKRGQAFKIFFHSIDYFWDGPTGNFKDIEEVPIIWKDEIFLKQRFELNFQYRLLGLIKAGADAFNTSYHLKINLSTYSWGIALINLNNHQPFIKKTYGEQLSAQEISMIVETAYEQVIDHISYNLDHINEQNRK